MKKLKFLRENSHTLLYLTLVVAVILSQFLLLKPVLGIGFPRDDWWELIDFKFMYGPNYFIKIINAWKYFGPHYSGFAVYLGTLDMIFKDNFKAYVFVGIGLKVLVTLSLYFPIYLIFKNKFLAFFTTLFYGLSHSSTGSLILFVNGGEYLSIFFLSIFTVAYVLLKRGFIHPLLFISSLFLFIPFLISPIRLFPVLFILILLEISFLIRRKSNFRMFIMRLVVFLLPIIFAFLIIKGKFEANYTSLDFFRLILRGNWHFTLIPFAGLGHMLVSPTILNFIWRINQNIVGNLRTYLEFISTGPGIIFVISTIFLSIFISKKPLKFFIKTSFFNILGILLVFVASWRYLYIPSEYAVKPGISEFLEIQYILLFTVYAVSLSFAISTDKDGIISKKIFTFVPLIGISFSLLLLIWTWIFIKYHFYYESGVHRYLTVPAIGVSLFYSGIWYLIYDSSRKGFRKILVRIILVIFVLFFVVNSFVEIRENFNGIKKAGTNQKMEKIMQDELIAKIPKDKLNGNLLIYIDTESTSAEYASWVTALDHDHIPFWLLFRKSYIISGKLKGCISSVYIFKDLQKSFEVEDNKGVFKTNAVCIDDSQNTLSPVFGTLTTFSLENLYAFRVEGPKLIDIKKDVQKKFFK